MSSRIPAGFHRANLVCPMLCVQQFVQLCSKGLHWLSCGVYSGFVQWYSCTSNGEIARQFDGHFSGQSCRMAVGAAFDVLEFFFFFFEKKLAF